MEFYKILQGIMSEKNMTIPDVSRATGIPDSTIRSIITRKTKNISLEVAFKLSKGLDVTLERLNGNNDIKTPTTKNDNSVRKMVENYNTNLTSSQEKKILDNFNKLNDIGKNKACERVYELTLIQQYSNSIETKAAHNDYLHEEGELDRMNEDFEDMKKW